MEVQENYQKLQKILREMDCVVIAFSSGVDPVFLLKAAQDARVTAYWQ